MLVPFIAYADFESFTVQLSTCQPNPEKSYTKQHQKHILSGFCYHITCFDDTLNSQQPVTFVKEFNDDDVAQIFIDTLEKNIKEIYKKFKFPKDMIMTRHDKFVYDNSTNCHICNENSVKIECAIIVICLVSLEVLLMKSATNTRCQRFSQLYFTICLATTITFLLIHWVIAKVIFLVYQIMKKTTFHLNGWPMMNLMIG